MNDYDKIRVLWIDDREEMDGYPEGQITPVENLKWFEIVHPGSKDEALSFRSVSEFAPVIHNFWFAGDTSILPAEIIATDYNLSKAAGVAIVDQTDVEIDEDLNDIEGDEEVQSVQSIAPSSQSSFRGPNFEGLIISLFYGTLAYKHPTAIVPMTRYLSKMPSEVDTLHALVEPFLGVDFQYIALEDRRWESILKEGVRHLRQRISCLFRSHDITLLPSELIGLAEGSGGILTVRSPHTAKCESGSRRLPVEGLFIDFSKEERSETIKKWAGDLLSAAMVDCNQIKNARELADLVLDVYESGTQSDSDLVEDRKNLSLLAHRKHLGKNIDQENYDQLCERFGVVKKKAKLSCTDIVSTGNYSDRERRWAALFITLGVFKRLIMIRKRVEKLHIEDYADIHFSGPTLTTDDLFLALFPVPESPLVLPWHDGSTINSSSTWSKALMRLKETHEVGKDRGDIALSVGALLAGEGWHTDGPYGLTDTERRLLLGFALEDKDLNEADWQNCTGSCRVLWGKQQGVGDD